MIGIRTIAAGVFAVVVLAGAAGLAQSQTPSGYLAVEALPDSLVILGPPPASDSAEAAAERANFLATRALAGTPRWTQAAVDNELFGDKAHIALSCAAGVAITVKDTPTLSRMLDRLVFDAGRSVSAAKNHFMRERPLIAHPDAPVCLPREDWMKTNGSYPSGHAAVGWAWGLVMTELLPAKATPLAARGRAFGESRVVCGLHFPSDVAAGQLMASATVAKLHSEPEFLKDLAAAKAELAQAPPATGCPA
ncbi:MAG: phosphatase PAP2 family protein [Caulobacter sp.]|nr:phosphatase PAP2 family protein [Caulobacter sp.]